MIDETMGWSEMISTNDIPVKDVAEILVRFGAPVYITKDQCRPFKSQFCYALAKLVEVKKILTTHRHSQSAVE